MSYHRFIFKPVMIAVMHAIYANSAMAAVTLPSAPQGLGFVETVAVPAAPNYIDTGATNQRGDARYATVETNAGVRVVRGFLDIWTPRTPFVDAGVSVGARDGFPAVSATDWDGIPGSATDGTVKNSTVHNQNLQYVIDATNHRTPAQAAAAYFDDRRGKGYSVTDGLGPLTSLWRTAAQQTTTITSIPLDATTRKYDDAGNNLGVGAPANTTFGKAVTFVDWVGTSRTAASTEPAKRYFKYARPWRWTNNVVVVPELEPAKSTTPITDGGFISGHTAEGVRDAIGMAYLVPERFQELMLRALELGENRILGGMHSPLDVIGGRIQGQAATTYGLNNVTAAERKDAYDQAHATLKAAANVTTLEGFNDFAHSANLASDRFADHDANKANYKRLLTIGFSQIADGNQPAVVPKGAEQLLETRLPYLSADQRRVVLKTTALPSGYPIMDDAEGWGRLNLFDAADGYGAFNGDVTVNMNASLGGFNAADTWSNNISGAGLLTKLGSGALTLRGNNTYTGGTLINGGSVIAASATAFGTGDVYNAATVATNAKSAVTIAGNYSQTQAASLNLTIGANNAGQLQVNQTATIAGGNLNVDFANGFTLGSKVRVIAANQVSGQFSNKTVSNGSAQYMVSYASNGVDLSKLGDFSGDGVINTTDVNLLVSKLNQTVNAQNAIYDLNNDGVINALDSRKLVTLCSNARCM